MPRPTPTYGEREQSLWVTYKCSESGDLTVASFPSARLWRGDRDLLASIAYRRIKNIRRDTELEQKETETKSLLTVHVLSQEKRNTRISLRIRKNLQNLI